MVESINQLKRSGLQEILKYVLEDIGLLFSQQHLPILFSVRISRPPHALLPGAFISASWTPNMPLSFGLSVRQSVRQFVRPLRFMG